MLKIDDRITFVVSGISFVYTVRSSTSKYWMSHPAGNKLIFSVMGVNPLSFFEVHGITTHGGGWPEVKSLEELQRQVDAINAHIAANKLPVGTVMARAGMFGCQSSHVVDICYAIKESATC